MKRLTNRRELSSAGLMMLIGLGTAIGSLDYQTGTLSRMGPGFFPLMLGLLLVLVSLLIIVTPVSQEDEQAHLPLSRQIRPWTLVITGMVAFIILGKYGGLIPAAMALIFISAMGDKNNTVKGALILAIAVTAVSVGIFHYGMQMQFPLFRWG